jgi:hypothetical protein
LEDVRVIRDDIVQRVSQLLEHLQAETSGL